MHTEMVCQRFVGLDHSGSSSIRRTEESLSMCMWNGTQHTQSFGSSRFAWKEAEVLAGRRLDKSNNWSRNTRLVS